MSEKKKKPTVHDIAKHLKVSASTVSRALNDHPKISQQTKDKVKEMALSLGYAQNISLSLRQEIIGKTIGLFVPELERSKYSLMVESCRKVLESQGYQLVVCCSSNDPVKEQQIIRLFDNIGVVGIIGSLATGNKKYNYLYKDKEDRPIVLFDRISFDVPCSKVMIDHFQAGFRAVQHLLKTGCKKIAHIGGSLDCPLTKQISTGYKTASRNAGLVLNPKAELFSNNIYDDALEAAGIILRLKDKPDAIIVDDIFAAQKMVSVLLTRKINIPNEIAIVAIGDDRDYSYYSPSITTIQMPYEKMGNKAANVLLNQLNQQNVLHEDGAIVIPFELNIRNSTLKV